MASLVSPSLRDPKLHYEPSPRYGHYTATIGGKLYTWGGRTQDFSDIGKAQLLSAIEIFDPSLETWKEQATSGVTPPGLYNGVCAAINESMYLCCGNDGNDLHNTLHQFDTTKLQWKQIRVQDPSEGPMRKTGCGMVAYQGDKLVLFAGYGIPSGPIQRGANYSPSSRTNAIGWSNEFHIFHLKEGIWSSPSTTGERPPPSSAFSFTAIDDHRVVFFGGYERGRVKINDVYILDLQAMHWRKLSNPGGVPWPGVRSAHSACCLNFGEEHPQLLVTGGRDIDNNILNDAWLLDVDSATWQELQLPSGTPHRWGHTTTAFSPTSGLVETIMFGGSSTFKGVNNDDDFLKIAETIVLQFESIEVDDRREWLLVGVADKGQLGTPERVREKMDRLEQSSRAAEGGAEATRETQNIEIRVAQEKVKEANRRAQEARMEAETLKKELETKERHLREENKRAVQEANKKTLEARREVEALLKEAQARERVLEQKETAVDEATEKAENFERHLQLKENQIKKEQHQMQMKEVEVLTLQYNLQESEERVKQKEEEMRVQQLQSQAEKDQFTNQLQSLERQVREKDRRFKEEMEELQHNLQENKNTIEIQGEEMKVQQMQSQQEKDQLTSQVHSLQHQVSEKERQFKQEMEELQKQVKIVKQGITIQMQQLEEKFEEISPKISERPQLAIPYAVLVQEAEVQQKVQQHHEQQLIEQTEEIHQQKSDLAQVSTRDAATITVDDTRRSNGADLEKETELSYLKYNIHQKEEQIGEQEECIQQQKEHIQRQKEHMDEVWKQVDQLQELVSVREAEIHHLQRQVKMAKWSEPTENLLPGTEVVAERTLHLTSQAQSYEWREYGFMLHVPEGSLPLGMTETAVRVRVSLSGQFKLPVDSKLVSGVYWLSCHPKPYKFCEPLTLEIQHCIAIYHPSHCFQLSFVISKNMQKSTHVFKELKGGEFNQYSSYGSISLTSFSRVAIVLKQRIFLRVPTRFSGRMLRENRMKRVQRYKKYRVRKTLQRHPMQSPPGEKKCDQLTLTQVESNQNEMEESEMQKMNTTRSISKTAVKYQEIKDSPKERYCALVYKKRVARNWEVNFVVIRNLHVCHSVVQEEYTPQGRELGLSYGIRFMDDKITLSICPDGLTLKDGWNITPLTYPVIRKYAVDNFSPGISIPACFLVVRCMRDHQPPDLMHKVPLAGAREEDYFMLYIASDLGSHHPPERLALECVGTPAGEGTEISPSKPILKDLMTALYNTMADKWKMIGVLLEISRGKLAIIAEKYSFDPQKCLLEMLGENWLERVHPPATWAAIIEAVEFLGEEQLAKELREKYTQ